MYLQQARKGYTDFGRYLAIFLLTIVLNFLSSVPVFIIYWIRVVRGELAFDPSTTGFDFSALDVSQNTGLILVLAPLLIVFWGLAFIIKRLQGFTWTEVFTSYTKFRWKHFLLAGLFWFILLGVVEYISYMINPENYSFHFEGTQFFILLIISIAFIPFQASWEELYFRGNLMQGFAVATNTRYLPLIITSVAFGFVHIMNPEVKEFGIGFAMAQYMGFGLLLGILVIMDGGLEMAFGVHTLNNIYGIVFVSYQGSVIQGPSLMSSHDTDPALSTISLYIVAVIFLIILKKLFKWKSFRWIFTPLKREGRSVEDSQLLDSQL